MFIEHPPFLLTNYGFLIIVSLNELTKGGGANEMKT